MEGIIPPSVAKELTLEIGVVLPTTKGHLKEVGAYARMAEESGLSGVYATEATIDGLSTALHAALSTKKVTIGTSIANIYYRHPSLAGMTASHINEISDGRMALGLGTSHQVINAPRGINIKRPLSTMREYVKEVKRFLWGEPMPKLYLGALRHGMTRLAASETDGAILNMIPLTRIKESVAVFKKAAKDRTDGKEPKLTSFMGICISNDLSEARNRARIAISYYFRMVFYRKLMEQCGYGHEAEEAGAAWEKGDESAAVNAIPDRMVDELFLCGTPERCRETLQNFHEAGVDSFIVSARGDASNGGDLFKQAVNTLSPLTTH